MKHRSEWPFSYQDENIIRYFAGSEVVNIALVVSNKSDAPALEKARRLGVPTEVVSKSQLSDSSFMLPLLRERDIHFIVLAGFLLMIPDYLIAAYPRCIINLHPSLLPKFGGKGMYGHRVHEAVRDNSPIQNGDITRGYARGYRRERESLGDEILSLGHQAGPPKPIDLLPPPGPPMGGRPPLNSGLPKSGLLPSGPWCICLRASFPPNIFNLYITCSIA